MVALTPDYIRELIREAFYAIRDLTDDDLLYGPVEKYFKPLSILRGLGYARVGVSNREDQIPSQAFPQTMARIENLFWMAGLRYEMEFTERLLRSSAPLEEMKDFIHYEAYQQTTRSEVAGANLQAGDKIVFVGSGPLPISLVLLYQEFGIESVGIEIDPRCYQCSRRLIDGLGLSKKIELILGDHFRLPLEQNIEHHIVGLDARPKQEIFAHLAKVLNPGASVSYRFAPPLPKPDCLGNIFSGKDSTYQKFPGFREIAVTIPKPPAVNFAVFLQRNGAEEAVPLVANV